MNIVIALAGAFITPHYQAPPPPPPVVVPVVAPAPAATVAPAPVGVPVNTGETSPQGPSPVVSMPAPTAAPTPAPAPTAPALCHVEGTTTQAWNNPNEDGSSAPAGTTGGANIDCSDVPAFESSFPPGTTFTVTSGDAVTQTTSGPEQRAPLP